LAEKFKTYRSAVYKELVNDLLKRVPSVSGGPVGMVRGMEKMVR
jgi:hypothetical protein